jgi:hypothetical protein
MPGKNMYASPQFAAIAAVVVLVTLDVAAYVYGGTPLFVTAICTSVVAFAGWMATTYRRPPGAPAALGFYISTLVALMALYAKQWHGDRRARA